MAEERPQLEALNAWFRLRNRKWWRRHWLLAAASFLLMLAGSACYFVFTYSNHYVAYPLLQICFDSYFLLIAPVAVILLLAHHAIHQLPTQEITLAFDPILLYQAALSRIYSFAFMLFATLWLLPWIAVCADMSKQMGHIESFLVLLFAQQLILTLALLQMQIYFLIRNSITSFASISTFAPSLLIFAVNLPLLLWFGAQYPSEETIITMLQWSLVAAGVLLVALIIRTVRAPSEFLGYWETK